MMYGLYSDDFFLSWWMNARDHLILDLIDRRMQTIELELGF